jgi:hypothetical protein
MTGPSRQVLHINGWDGPSPVEFLFGSLEKVEQARGLAEREMFLLEPQIARLERDLGPAARSRTAYRASKLRRELALRITEGGIRMAAPSGRSGGGASVRPPCWPMHAGSMQEQISAARRLVLVGKPRPGGELERKLQGRGAEATCLAPGEGSRIYSPTRHPERYRPAAASHADWVASSSERERSAVEAIVLGIDATALDVSLLAHRVYPHQTIIAERGSVAAAWLAVQWDGPIHAGDNCIMLSNAGDRFCAPGTPSALGSRRWPRITVVTPSFNQRKFLEDCISSVVGQNYPDLEYIVTDAGSTDGSIDLLRDAAPHFSRLIIERDDGQSDGLAKGFALATGDILTWINSDDMLAPNSLKRAALAFLEFGCDMVAGTVDRIGERSDELLWRCYPALPTLRPVELDYTLVSSWSDGWRNQDYFYQPEVFFSRTVWQRAGAHLKRHLYWSMDWELWTRFAMTGAVIVRIPDLLGYSRLHKNQKTQNDLYLPQMAGIFNELRQVFAATADWLRERC